MMEEDYFLYHKLMFKLTGISLDGKASFWFRLYSYIVLLVLVISPILDIAELSSNVEINFNNRIVVLVYLTGHIIGFGDGFILYFNRKELEIILNSLQKNFIHFWDNSCKDALEESKLSKKMAYEIRMVVIAYAAFVIVTSAPIFGTITIRIFSNKGARRILPFFPVTKLNITQSPQYEIAWFIQSFTVELSALIFLTINLVFASFSAQIILQFKVLHNYTRDSLKTNCDEIVKKDTFPPSELVEYETISWKYTKRILKNIVVHHSNIIELADQFENIYNKVLLVQQCGILFCLCGLMYHATSLETLDIRFVTDLAVSIVLICEVMAICYWANETTLASGLLGDACYQIDFHMVDVTFQRALNLVVLRSQRPVIFTAGKIVPFSLITAVSSFKAAFSYFMVLRNLKKSH